MKRHGGDGVYIALACVATFFVFATYVIQFYFVLGFGLSSNSTKWSDFGGYVGGVLGPLLSFISIVLLIKSLRLQNDANASLKEDLKNSEKTERLRSFEALFFNMIDSQKTLFNHLSIDRVGDGGESICGVEAVLWIERSVECIRIDDGSGPVEGSADAVRDFIDGVDVRDQIYGIMRSFYITVKLINEKLSSDFGFDVSERKSHIQTLVNFTDFAQLRLVLICMQFMARPAVDYLKNDVVFVEVINESGLGFNHY